MVGAKGMISKDSRISGEVLRLRPSMIKFQMAKASQIEICGAASKPLPMHLNRQYIKIMEDLGVNVNVFLRLQHDAVDTLRKTTLSATNASKFLKSQRIGTPARIWWLVKKLHSKGFEFLEDHFLRASLELAVLSKLRDLKHRARIPVEHATTMYGIMDETGYLAEDQIYCRMDDSVITGTVTVTRAPALHPGDIQIVRAVDVPASCALRDIYNCIVFSQHGQRDFPSMLSGGDLDGDLYSVIWDQRLLPSRTYEAADYPKVPSKDIGRAVTTKDITDFFLEFMQNDQLGRIANTHVQLADTFTEGTLHQDCLKLAELHSTAVDFSKTGIPVCLESTQHQPQSANHGRTGRLEPDTKAQKYPS